MTLAIEKRGGTRYTAILNEGYGRQHDAGVNSDLRDCKQKHNVTVLLHNQMHRLPRTRTPPLLFVVYFVVVALCSESGASSRDATIKESFFAFMTTEQEGKE